MRQLIELLLEDIPWYREHRLIVAGVLFSITFLPIIGYTFYTWIRTILFVEKSDYKSQQKKKLESILLKTSAHYKRSITKP